MFYDESPSDTFKTLDTLSLTNRFSLLQCSSWDFFNAFSQHNKKTKMFTKLKKLHQNFVTIFFYNNLLFYCSSFLLSSLYFFSLCLKPSFCKLSKEESPLASLSSSKMLPKYVRQPSTNSQVKEEFHLKRSKINIKKNSI